MLIKVFTHGVAQIFKISWTLKRIIRTVHPSSLEQNYRSTKIILDAANAVIENNEGRPKKNLWTDKTEGLKFSILRLQSEHEEAAFIGDTIAKSTIFMVCLMVIWLFCTVQMLNLVYLKKR